MYLGILDRDITRFRSYKRVAANLLICLSKNPYCHWNWLPYVQLWQLSNKTAINKNIRLFTIFQINIRNRVLDVEACGLLTILGVNTSYINRFENTFSGLGRGFRSAVMDPKSKKVYHKIENFLEERKESDRRKDETAEQAKANENRRTGEDRRELRQ